MAAQIDIAKQSRGKVMRVYIWPIVLFLIISGGSATKLTVNCNGSSDFSEIQSAINAATDGDEILVGDGLYRENLVVNRSVTLRGDGNATVEGSEADSPVINITSRNVTLEGLVITNATATVNGSSFGAIQTFSDGCKLLNNTIYNSSVHGILLSSSSNHRILGNHIYRIDKSGICSLGSDNNEIVENHIHDIGEDGVFMVDCIYNTISNNEIYNISECGVDAHALRKGELHQNEVCLIREDGVYLEGSWNNVLLDNRIYENENNGITLFNSSCNNYVGLNNVVGCGVYGMLAIDSSDDNVIVSNTFSDNGLSGIGIYGSRSSTILRNDVFDNYNNGISVRESSDNNEIKENKVHGNARDGLRIEACSNNLLFMNVIYENRNGIDMDDSSDSTLIENEIYDNSIGVILEFSKNVFLAENELYNNTFGAVQYNHCTESKIARNDIHDNGDDGVHLADSSFIIVSDNAICNNSEFGIQLLDSSNQNTIMLNIIRNSGRGGIYAYEGDSNKYVGNFLIENKDFNAMDNGQGTLWLGNYYSDYQGEDCGDDGFGDEPYVIYGRWGTNAVDRRPVMNSADPSFRLLLNDRVLSILSVLNSQQTE